MQAIEFESTVQGQAIPLPAPGMLSPGQSVRVVVMFEELASQQRILIQDEPTHPATMPVERLAALGPHRDAISELSENPLVLPDFLPLSRDEAHER